MILYKTFTTFCENARLSIYFFPLNQWAYYIAELRNTLVIKFNISKHWVKFCFIMWNVNISANKKFLFPRNSIPWSVFEEAWYNFYGQVIVLALFSWFSSRYIRDFPNVNELIKPSLEKRVTLPLKRGYP